MNHKDNACNSVSHKRFLIQHPGTHSTCTLACKHIHIYIHTSAYMHIHIYTHMHTLSKLHTLLTTHSQTHWNPHTNCWYTQSNLSRTDQEGTRCQSTGSFYQSPAALASSGWNRYQQQQTDSCLHPVCGTPACSVKRGASVTVACQSTAHSATWAAWV